MSAVADPGADAPPADGIEIAHEPERSRWVLRIGPQLAGVLDYADDGRAVSMTRTFTNRPYRGRGYAERLVAAAVDDAERAGRTVTPMCWFVADWFDRHPDRAHLLS